MSLKDAIMDVNWFLNVDEFAEEVTYTPADGDPVVIKAVVVRQEINSGGENASRTLRNQAELFVSVADVVNVDRCGDRFTLKDVEGLNREARVAEILGHDDGMWHLLVGW